MMYSPQNSDYLLALSTEVSLVEELVLPSAFVSSGYTVLKGPVGNTFIQYWTAF